MTPIRLMRNSLVSLRLLKGSGLAVKTIPTATASPSSTQCGDPFQCSRHCRCFARVKDLDPLNREVWFTATVPKNNLLENRGDHDPPDARTLQLGKTIRTLHDRLPTLLKEPLPSEILSPQISLHLFPSTHPHLPTVSGRLAYVAALWTAPVAWGRVPLVGNVKLTIMSERMVRNGGCTGPLKTRDEKLIVKWRTCGKTTHRDGTGGIYRGMGIAARDPVDKIKDFIAGSRSASKESDAEAEEFCGIFVFEFDEKGRIVKHVIEHTDEGGRWDKMTRVVSVTDWLLGRFNGKGKEPEPALAFCEERSNAGRIHFVDRRRRGV